jgi:Flp pilus assembly protein TadG
MSRVSGFPGEGGQLRGHHPSEGSVLTLSRCAPKSRRARRGESGQALVEFALILFPLLLIVVGIIQFGIGLNYWLDEQRIANQGARWAVVNAWPGCARTLPAGSCTALPACTSAPTNTTLENYLECQAVSKGLRNSVNVTICYPDDGDPSNDGAVGSPVRVNVESQFKFVPLVGVRTITLRGKATMRLEQTTDPARPAPAKGHLTGVAACTS